MRTGKAVTNSSNVTTQYTYVYENNLLQKMTRGSRTFEFSYDAYGNPVSIAYRSNATSEPTYYYYALNSRGDVIALYDSTGNLYATYSYDAYGKFLVAKNASGVEITGNTSVAILNPLRYRGYVYDTETGFYYLQTRYYDPTACRFVNADVYCATGQGITGNNMFAYCNNNPIIYADPDGMCRQLWSNGFQGPCPGIFSPLCKDNQTNFDNQFHVLTQTIIENPIDKDNPPDHPDYKSPKNWNKKKVQNPNGKGRGWPAEDGGVWIPDDLMHGGAGWVIQYPNGNHSHAYPGGGVRNHFQLEQSKTESVVYLIGGGIALLWLIGNDVLGIGASDDGLIPAAVGCFSYGLDGFTGKLVCSVCGEVRYD